MEEGKDPATANRSGRFITWRFLQYLLLFLVLGLGISIISMNTLRYLGPQNQNTITPLHRSNSIIWSTEPSGLESWISPPKNLLHNMIDAELLWRASFVPKIKTYPYRRVPKIAFMFLTKGPLPLAPLWERFFKGNEKLFSIYIHSLPSYVADFPQASPFYKRQIPSQVAEWGMMSMCDAERRLLANALLDLSNEWFILLSESCIPVQNFSTVYRYISQSRHSFMGSFDEDGPYGRGRYNPYMAPEVNLTEWRKGSQWFEVNRELAVAIIRDSKYYPKFKRFCRPACYVDEHYFPTMLSIHYPDLMANRTLTWVDWSRGGAHPATFGQYDITKEFLKKILKSNCTYNDHTTTQCFLFARKFSHSSLEPLLALAAPVLGIH
ncbi:hypothetical protein SAY86_031679 [Trapa natans]|uniref:Core-2/I-branching beta-1,6-N-acetylglucosaminyltransferase family protein n=1 Tax=Trapa natans TaxID=22666 RepID=A0AAN7R8J0_TRANT|nr:hypothetical protein SAY86_031679 [Trapa natans]